MSDSTILVVEDEVAIRDMIGMSLERAGFRWLAAGSVEEARTLLADSAPDLLLLDWMLPGTSGLDFARQLRRDASNCDLPVIMLTARDAEEDMVRGLEGGVDDYLTKPFSTWELIARIKAVFSVGISITSTGWNAGITGAKKPSHLRLPVSGVKSSSIFIKCNAVIVGVKKAGNDSFAFQGKYRSHAGCHCDTHRR